MADDKEFEFEGVRYLLSGNSILWRWDGEKWVIHAMLGLVKNPGGVINWDASIT